QRSFRPVLGEDVTPVGRGDDLEPQPGRRGKEIVGAVAALGEDEDDRRHRPGKITGAAANAIRVGKGYVNRPDRVKKRAFGSRLLADDHSRSPPWPKRPPKRDHCTSSRTRCRSASRRSW